MIVGVGVSVSVGVGMSVCRRECVCEREREREGQGILGGLTAPLCVTEGASVCMWRRWALINGDCSVKSILGAFVCWKILGFACVCVCACVCECVCGHKYICMCT